MQVQNISQSMEVLDLRTYRDLQYVRNTESLMKGLDSRLKVAAESQKNLNAKSFQVSPTPPASSHTPWDPLMVWCCAMWVGTLGTVLLLVIWVAECRCGGPGAVRPCGGLRAEHPCGGPGGRASLWGSWGQGSLRWSQS